MTPAARVALGGRLRTLRLEAGLTQAELAERLHFNLSTVVRWESGQRMPTATTLAELGDAYGVTLDWLILGRSSDAHGRVLIGRAS